MRFAGIGAYSAKRDTLFSMPLYKTATVHRGCLFDCTRKEMDKEVRFLFTNKGRI